MKGRRILTMLALGLVLALAAGLSLAEGPSPSRQGEGRVEVSTQAALGTAASTEFTLNSAEMLSTSFTYQGQLKQDGNLVNGTCDFLFSLWDALTGGSQVGSTLDRPNVSVANGLFTIPDLDFGGSAFTGEARWLEISVRCPAGSGSYTALDPRQALTAAPYALTLRPGAIISGTAYQNLKVVSNAPTGGIPAALTGEMLTAKDGVGVYGSHNNTAADAGGAGVWGRTWSPQGAGVEGTGINGAKGVKGTSDSGDGVYGESSGIGVRGKSAGFAGVWGESTSFVGVWGQSTSNTGVYGVALDTSGTTYGVEGSSHSPTGYGGYFVNEPILGQGGGGVGVYGKSDSGISVYGVSSTGYAGRFDGTVQVNGNAVISGTAYQNLKVVSNAPTGGIPAALTGEMFTAEDGVGVYGSNSVTATNASGTGVWGRTWSPLGAGVRGTGGAYGVTGHSESGIGVYGTSWSPLGSGVAGTGLGGATGVYGYSTSGYAGYFEASSVGAGVMITGTAYQNLKVVSNHPGGGIPAAVTGEIFTAADGVGVYGSNSKSTTHGTGIGIWGQTWSGGGAWVKGTGYNGATGVYGSSDYGFAGRFEGTMRTNVLQIAGGSDLAEKFAVSNSAGIEPGTLLVIDEDNPGRLKISDSAYDTRVAGIVSGAGGLQPGLTLQQEGVMDGDVLVAIAGRAYVKAEAISGPIRPGDLLTTSSLPGYAMKATDRGRAYGAVIGKAMSELTHGTGLVLVLVNLQ